MKLIFVYELEHLNKEFLDEYRVMDSAKIVTADLEVAFFLEQKKIDYIDEWSFISPQELNINREKAWDYSYGVSRGFIDTSNQNPEIFERLACQELIYPVENCLNAITIFNKLFDTEVVDSILIYLVPQVPVIRTGPKPTKRALHSITQGVLLHIAELRGIKVSLV